VDNVYLTYPQWAYVIAVEEFLRPFRFFWGGFVLAQVSVALAGPALRDILNIHLGWSTAV
jgi:hypothetical protein